MALQDANVVVIPAGIPRKPGMSRIDLFHINASIVQQLVEVYGEICPETLLAINSNPVNSTWDVQGQVYTVGGTLWRDDCACDRELVSAAVFRAYQRSSTPRAIRKGPGGAGQTEQRVRNVVDISCSKPFPVWDFTSDLYRRDCGLGCLCKRFAAESRRLLCS
ncbi:hypothetical protein KL925_001204 [Ogataea polymorpha]|nr:hypothetical protein KL925_001204 [Ogataea polymorpha]